MHVGVSFTPFETRADVILRIAVRADEAGLERLDVAEGWTHDGFLLLAEAAAATRRIGLATAIVSMWGRTPGTLALAAAGLQRLSGGRFALGIGASSPPLTEGFHGVRWEEPVAQLRGTLTAVRALLAGERLPDAPAGSRALKLGVLPEVPVPIELAALAPASVRLAGELADAWLPFLWARSRVQDGRALLREGEARAAAPSPTRVALGIPVALGPDEAAARRLAAWWLSTYVTRMGPLYPRMLRDRFGLAEGVDAVAERGPGELPAVAERLAREVTLFGTYDEAGDVLASWLAAGADALHLALPPGHPEAGLEELVDVIAAAGRVPA